MEWTIVVLTDVSAAAKGQTNRARSEVAGVVSGAGQVSQCFKHLRLMRVLQVGQGDALTQYSLRLESRGVGCHFSKAVEMAGVC